MFVGYLVDTSSQLAKQWVMLKRTRSTLDVRGQLKTAMVEFTQRVEEVEKVLNLTR